MQVAKTTPNITIGEAAKVITYGFIKYLEELPVIENNQPVRLRITAMRDKITDFSIIAGWVETYVRGKNSKDIVADWCTWLGIPFESLEEKEVLKIRDYLLALQNLVDQFSQQVAKRLKEESQKIENGQQ